MPDLFGATMAGHADRVAIRYFDGLLTWRDVDAESDALAAALTARGLAAGDRAVLLTQNIPQFAIFVIALWKIGAIPVPSNPAYREGELGRLFADCQPRAILAQTDEVGTARRALDAIGADCLLLVADPRDYQTRDDPLIPQGDEPGVDCEMLGELISGHRGQRPPAFQADPDAIGLIMYTSGTTGTPRGAMMRQSSLAFNARVFCNLTETGPDDRIFAAAPFFHITGMICHLAAACASGCSMALPYRLVAGPALELLREHRPTVTIAAITAFNALMNAPGAAAADFASLRHVSSGGAPVAPALHEEIRLRTGMEIHIGYGMTETTSPAVFTPVGAGIPVHPEHGALSIGIPTPGTEVRVVDEEGRDVPYGAPGELCMRGPQIMTGYWRKPVETGAVLSADGWLRSGDVAVIDEGGWIYLVDRKKDVIVASGFKVWPREVEDALHAHPAVREAAVVGAPDAYRGETVCAYVSLKPDMVVRAEELIAHCGQCLTGYKRPRRVEIVDELPKTVTGKIQRNVLRERARVQG
jgi:long-chain acyl-CoA synthetase